MPSWVQMVPVKYAQQCAGWESGIRSHRRRSDNGKDLLTLTPEDRSREGIFSFQYPVEIPV